MQDEIRIEELEIYAKHGVYPEENEKGQNSLMLQFWLSSC